MAIRELTLGALAGLTLVSVAGDPPNWKAMLMPNDGSHLNGTVNVDAVGRDSARTTIAMTGGEPGKTLAWHIHRGACGTRGEILGAATAYPGLTLGRDGAGSLSVTLPVVPPATGQYSVTVHRSTSDMTPAACGELKATPPMGRDSMPPMRGDSMPPLKGDSMPPMRDSVKP